ncbi:MAG: FAD-dependent oxidoreductase [Actinomycetota bacterium]|nr:FAD-dependent oxidoreductase [Actinomycetota bacterium]
MARRAGLDVVVLEREGHVGGLAASFAVAGVRVDHGSHRLHPSTDPAILAELRALMGSDLQLRRRNGRIRLEGRWIGFPLRPANLLRNLPPGFALAAARDAASSWARKTAGDSFADVLRGWLGPTMCERFYFPYARKLWGVEPEEIDADQARRRVSSRSAGNLLRSMALGKGVLPGSHFYYPRRGFGQIAEALADAASDAGAQIRLRSSVERIVHSRQGFQAWTSGGGRVDSRMLWSTIPLPVLARLAEPSPAAPVLDAATSLHFRSMLLVYLVVAQRPYTPYDAHYLPGPDTPVTRISEPANYRDGNDPGDVTVLCAEIPCSRQDELWSAADETLAGLVLKTLAKTALPPARPVACEVKRVANAYPIYLRGYRNALGRLEGWASEAGVVTFGRQGLFAHDNSHHALAMAWAAADALRSDGTFDEASWAESRRRFETHVVED